MHILMSNDDGIQAPGLRDLAYKLSKQHRVTVVAPMYEQSGKSHALTTEQAIQVKRFPDGGGSITWIAINGTPTDCVKWALSYELAEDMPDLLISGVNNGYNLGSDALYSGTVAAAMEGLFYQVPSLALSVNTYLQTTGEKIFPIVENILDIFYNNEIKVKGYLLNVNFPDCESYTRDQVEVVHQGFQHYFYIVEDESHRHGKDYFWIGGKKAQPDSIHDTDVHLIHEGKITVVPLTWIQEDREQVDIFRNILQNDESF